MTGKVAVIIRILSESDDQVIEQEARGDVYLKGDYEYIRYEENTAELGRTSTVIKLGQGQIRILRQGEVASEQSFEAGRRLPGYYETPQGRLTLATSTAELHVGLKDGIGEVRWSYTLLLGEEEAGYYRIRLRTEPAPPVG